MHRDNNRNEPSARDIDPVLINIYPIPVIVYSPND